MVDKPGRKRFLQALGVKGRIVLRYIPKKQDKTSCAGVIWFRVGIRVEVL
jgi:hypothetical protein